MLRVLLGIDQLANALLGGWPDESVSSRAYRMSASSAGWMVARAVIDTAFFFQPDHCEKAFESERKRLQEPPELRA